MQTIQGEYVISDTGRFGFICEYVHSDTFSFGKWVFLFALFMLITSWCDKVTKLFNF